MFGTAGLAAAPSLWPAEAAVGDSIPLRFTNNSGRGEQLYIYILGRQGNSLGWADVNGGFNAWPTGAEPPAAAPDASIPGPANGESKNLVLPRLAGGRVYFSFGEKLVFKLATGGLVQPAVQNPSDPNANILFNTVEFTLNDLGLFINNTQVDFFSAPSQVGLRKADGGTLFTGRLKPGGYTNFFKALESQPGGWDKLIKRRSDGTILRALALAPGHGIEAGAPLGSSMDDYVNRVWDKYRNETLTVTPVAHEPDRKYFGRVSGDVMNLTTADGQFVTAFQKPDTDSVLGCHKRLDAPDGVRGEISRTICAGLNRSTLLTHSNQPHNVPGEFYKDGVTNHYARIAHAQMADGKAYAFPFDDVGTNESLVHDGNPTEAYITLDPFD